MFIDYLFIKIRNILFSNIITNKKIKKFIKNNLNFFYI